MKGDSGGMIVDFARELYGSIEIRLRALTGNSAATLRVRFGESVVEVAGQQSYWEEAVRVHPNSQIQLGETGFRFARLEIIESGTAATIEGIAALSSLRDLEYRGSFRCSDERLNRIWRVGAETVHLCMQTELWDGIKRGRTVWAGDLYPASRVVSVAFGEHPIVAASLDELRDKSLAGFAEEPSWMNGISAYSLWWLLAQSRWYLDHGNHEYLEQQRGYLKRLLSKLFRSIDATGRERLDGWRFLDWVTEREENEPDIHAGFQSLFVLAMEAAISLCGSLAESTLAQKCRTCLAQLRKSVPELSRSNQIAALLALAGFYPPASVNHQVLAVDPLRDLTPFLAYAVLEARTLADDHRGCLQLIRDYWGAMLDLGATTFWEDFDPSWVVDTARIDELALDGKRQFPIGFGRCSSGVRMSLCHGWSCGATAWLSEHVLGVRPLKPGYRALQLTPHLAGLEWAEGTLPTPQGTVHVRHVQNGDGSIATEIDSPTGIAIQTANAESL